MVRACREQSPVEYFFFRVEKELDSLPQFFMQLIGGESFLKQGLGCKFTIFFRMTLLTHAIPTAD